LEEIIQNDFQWQGFQQFRGRRNGNRKKRHSHALPMGPQQFKDVQSIGFFQFFRLMIRAPA
jgi:hypothetical protein